MSARCIELALAQRDPETILGPLLWLLTRLARGEDDPAASAELRGALVAHCSALAAHPAVAPALRITLGSIAIEHRRCTART